MAITGRKYVIVVAAVGIMVILALAGLVNGTGTTSSSSIEKVANSTGNRVVDGKCIINGPWSVVCVPVVTPKGSPLTRYYEDGSARYENGSVYDADTGSFR